MQPPSIHGWSWPLDEANPVAPLRVRKIAPDASLRAGGDFNAKLCPARSFAVLFQALTRLGAEVIQGVHVLSTNMRQDALMPHGAIPSRKPSTPDITASGASIGIR